MSKWKEWGAYITAIVESGGTFGQPITGYDRVESDYLYPQIQAGYGGGIGVIQFTSNNFALLQEMKKRGLDMSPLKGTDLGQALDDNNAAGINWGVGSWTGGIFDIKELEGLKKILPDKISKDLQQEGVQNYFDRTNGWLTQKIANSGLPDTVKAMVCSYVVLAPGYGDILLAPPMSTTPEGMHADMNSVAGSGYYGRNQEIYDLAMQISDFNASPPTNFWDATNHTDDGIVNGGSAEGPPPGKPKPSAPQDSQGNQPLLVKPDVIMLGNLHNPLAMKQGDKLKFLEINSMGNKYVKLIVPESKDEDGKPITDENGNTVDVNNPTQKPPGDDKPQPPSSGSDVVDFFRPKLGTYVGSSNAFNYQCTQIPYEWSLHVHPGNPFVFPNGRDCAAAWSKQYGTQLVDPSSYSDIQKGDVISFGVNSTPVFGYTASAQEGVKDGLVGSQYMHQPNIPCSCTAQYGHVAVVGDVRSDAVYLFQQNLPGSGNGDGSTSMPLIGGWFTLTFDSVSVARAK